MQFSARAGLVALAALTLGLVACDPDVNYLRAGSGGLGGASGSGDVNTSGSGGTLGGDTSIGGTEAGSGGDATGGTSGSGGDASGGTAGIANGGTAGITSLCIPKQSKLVELFTFEDTKPPIANVVDGSPGTWQKGPYDTTDTNTGFADITATPPTNLKNLANLSKLELESSDGKPLPALKISIPFSGKNVINPATTKPEPEHMHLIYVFAQIGHPADTVDFTARRFTADVKAVSNPRADCQLRINAWTTGTNAGATTFMHVDGPSTVISGSDWAQVTMDLAASTPKTAVNQYGFSIDSSCAATTAAVDGLMTVLLIDNIQAACD